jgi:hypothetical protein
MAAHRNDDIIPPEMAARLIAAARAAGGGSDWTSIRVLLSLLTAFGSQNDALRCATALELIRLAMRLDPHCEHVRWN